MSKRKGGDDGDDSDVSIVDVDFEFFDPNPKVDYLALKRLFKQLFQADADMLHVNKLVELVLSQPLVGSTVKTDGIESDPYAFLTVLNIHVHKDHPSVKALTTYILDKSSADSSFYSTLQPLIGTQALESQNHVALVLTERLINMPVQVAPPMYRLLLDEIKWANDDNEPYIFTHFLFISRTYRLTQTELAEMAASNSSEPKSSRPSKRQKNKTPAPTMPVGVTMPDGSVIVSFHPEDEQIQEVALHVLDYPFTNAQPREPDSFGLDVAGKIILVAADKMPELVQKLTQTYPMPA